MALQSMGGSSVFVGCPRVESSPVLITAAWVAPVSQGIWTVLQFEAPPGP